MNDIGSTKIKTKGVDSSYSYIQNTLRDNSTIIAYIDETISQVTYLEIYIRLTLEFCTKCLTLCIDYNTSANMYAVLFLFLHILDIKRGSDVPSITMVRVHLHNTTTRVCAKLSTG